jgi:serine/threonine-protein kinase
VKVLDFGIAKAISTDGVRTDVHSTITDPLAGGALGTAAYMSPEQARGESVDHRTDIWAFACVVYEMLTGRRAFEGQSSTEVLARVLERDPDFGRLPAGTPEEIRRLLRRGFAKDPQQRLGFIGDALLELRDAASAAEGPRPAGVRTSPAPARWLWPLAGAAAGALMAALVLRSAAPLPPVPSNVSVPIPAAHEVVVGQLPALAVSRDGRHIVYRAREDGVMRLYRRSLDEADAVPLTGTEDVAGHAISPDGQYVAFVRDGQLYKMAIGGGAPAALTKVAGGAAISWGTPETVVFSGGAGDTLRWVSAAGGDGQVASTLDQAAGDRAHSWPELAADGRTLLLTVTTADGHFVAVTTLGTGDPPTRLTAGRQPRLLPSGLLVFARDRGLWTARFDARSRRLASEPMPAIDGVDRSGLNGFVHFGVSDSGDLVFVPFRERAGLRAVTWTDRTGRLLAPEMERRGITRFALSPDETQLAVAVADGDDRDIWVHHRQRGATTRLTADRGTETQPVWSPDGRVIAYRGDHEGNGVFVRTADGASPARRLTSAGDTVDIPYTFTPDGSRLLFTRFRDYSDQDVLSVPIAGGAPTPVLAERHAEMRPALSPDGRWLLYQSDQTGRLEVYLRPFPNVGASRWPVSTAGGTSPAWAADGSVIYFVEGTTLTSLSFRAASPPRLGRPQPLFDLGPSEDRLGSEFEASADGSRILVMRDAPGAAERPEVRLVLHWAAGR